MEKIKTVEQLVEVLKRYPHTGLQIMDIMNNTEIPREEFERYYCWSEERYTRNVLARDEHFEVLLICWEKGQQSPIHDFNAQEAWVHPIEGILREERFRTTATGLEKVSDTLLHKNEYSYMDEIGIHRYSNANNARTVSLNIYRKPVTEWNVYFSENQPERSLMDVWENKNFNMIEQEA